MSSPLPPTPPETQVRVTAFAAEQELEALRARLRSRRRKREEDALRPQTHDSAPLRRQPTSEPLGGVQADEEPLEK